MRNYFKLLEVEQRYDLDENFLHKQYLQLQHSTHPDRMMNATDKERNYAVQLSMDANEAYECLKNPLTRSQHLLALNGIRVNEDAEDAMRPSQSLLMEMLELREKINDEKEVGELNRIEHILRDQAELAKKRIEQAFEFGNLEEAAHLTIRLRYLGKTLEELHSRHYQLQQQKQWR